MPIGGGDENEIDVDLDPNARANGRGTGAEKSLSDVSIMNAKNEDRTTSFFAQPGILAGEFRTAGWSPFCICIYLYISLSSWRSGYWRRCRWTAVRHSRRHVHRVPHAEKGRGLVRSGRTETLAGRQFVREKSQQSRVLRLRRRHSTARRQRHQQRRLHNGCCRIDDANGRRRRRRWRWWWCCWRWFAARPRRRGNDDGGEPLRVEWLRVRGDGIFASPSSAQHMPYSATKTSSTSSSCRACRVLGGRNSCSRARVI